MTRPPFGKLSHSGHDQLSKQRMAALLAANEARAKRARDKTKVRTGRLKPAKILRDVPDHWRTAKLIDLLLLVPKVGRGKAQKMADLHGVVLGQTLEQIDAPTRERLAKTLEVRGWS